MWSLTMFLTFNAQDKSTQRKKMSAAAFGALGTTQAVSSMFVDVPWGERAI